MVGRLRYRMEGHALYQHTTAQIEVMTIYCRLCNCKIDSRKDLPAGKSEESDCLESLSRHLVSRHPKQALELKDDLDSLPLLLATYLLIKNFTNIPPESDSLQRHFEQNEQLLLDMFGAVFGPDTAQTS